MIHRIFGTPYNQPGPTHRGESRPVQNLPAPGLPGPLEITDSPKVAGSADEGVLVE